MDPTDRPLVFPGELFAHALARSDPMQIVAQHLPERPANRCVVIGAGKPARPASFPRPESRDRRGAGAPGGRGAGVDAPGDAPLMLLSGGEAMVTLRGAGLGGPNAEFVLAFALALDGTAGIYAIVCDTGGADGAAARWSARGVSPDTLSRTSAAGVNARAALARNDHHNFFAALHDQVVTGQVVTGQVVTGPTLTNGNDFRAILIYPRR